MPHPRAPRSKSSSKKRVSPLVPLATSTLVLVLGFFSLPTILAIDLKLADEHHAPPAKFTITVDPANKTITENPQVEALLNSKPTALSAAAAEAGNIFTWIAVAIADSPAYSSLLSDRDSALSKSLQ
jgi:hypothetical protein